MDACGLHAIDAADRAGQLALQCPQVIDVLDEGRRAERVGLVEDLVADRAALRQARLCELHAKTGNSVLGDHDDRAVALELIGDCLAFQVLDDRRAVLDRKIGE